jgi:hypothetical protein
MLLLLSITLTHSIQKMTIFLITLTHSIQKGQMGQAIIQRPQLHIGRINGEWTLWLSGHCMGFIMTFVIFTSPKVSSQILSLFTTLDAILQLSRHWSEWHKQFGDILHSHGPLMPCHITNIGVVNLFVHLKACFT